MKIGDLFYAIGADTKGVDQALDKVEGRATTVGGRVNAALSRGLTAGGAAAGALFAGAIGGATDFEEQLRTINTVAKLPDETLRALGADILDLSKETGKPTEDLTSGLYDLVSAGVPADQAIKVLRDSAILATGALGTTGEAVDLVTSALNAYGLGAESSTRVTDIFAQAVADGKVTAAELGTSLANVAPIAAGAGISLEEVAAGYAIATAKGVPAAQAATQMRAAIAALLTPNAQLNKIQKQTGINFAKLAEEKGLVVALDTLRESVGGNEEAFGKALGSIEAFNFAQITTGDNADAFAAELAKVEAGADAGGVALGQYEEINKSAAATGRRFLANIKALGIQVGGPFVDSLGAGVSVLGDMGTGLNGIFNLSRLVGGGLGALAGKALPKLVGGLAGLLPALLPTLAGLGSGIGGAIAAAIPVGMALLPVLLVAALVAAIAFLIANPELVGEIAKVAGEIVGNIIRFLGELPGRFVELIRRMFGDAAGDAAQFVFDVVGFILGIPAKLFALPGQVGKVFVDAGGRVVTAVLDFVGDVVDFILGIPGKIIGLIGRVGKIATDAAAALLAPFARAVETIAGLISNLGAPAGSANFQAFQREFKERFGRGPSRQEAERWRAGTLPGFSEGTAFVPQDMLAWLHRGERVLTADDNMAIAQGRAQLGAAVPDADVGRGGDTYQVNVEGLVKARDPFEIATQLRRVAEFGVLTPRVEPA